MYSLSLLRQIRPATSTLRPRSGKEYQNIDRSLLSLSQPQPELCMNNKQGNSTGTLRANYANITPVPENAESPSPGYQSGTSPQEQQGEHFMFKVSVLLRRPFDHNLQKLFPLIFSLNRNRFKAITKYSSTHRCKLSIFL